MFSLFLRRWSLGSNISSFHFKALDIFHAVRGDFGGNENETIAALDDTRTGQTNSIIDLTRFH